MSPTTFLSPDSLANLPLILISVVPGLIIAWIRSQFLTGRITSHSAALTYYVAVSFVYNAFTYPVIFHFAKQDQPNICVWFLITIIAPVTIGFLLGLEAQNKWIYNRLRKFNFNIIHPTETSWDYKFNKVAEGYGEHVIITLKNGKRVAGFFDENSFASSDLNKRDLYIANTYKIDKDTKKWTLLDRTGVLIDMEQISKVEFIRPFSEEDSQHE